jgi:hypothetical protein
MMAVRDIYTWLKVFDPGDNPMGSVWMFLDNSLYLLGQLSGLE